MFNLPPLLRTLNACQQDLSSTRHEVRLAVARDLGRFAIDDEREARLALLQVCLADEHPAVRRQALFSLADMDARPLLQRVESMLTDPDLHVRQIAVLALGEIAHPEDTAAIGRIAGLLKAGAPAIRYQALLAYANLCPAQCSGDLLVALDDEDLEVRKLALRLIDEILINQNRPLSTQLLDAVLVTAAQEDLELALLAQLVCAELRLKAPRGHLLAVVERKMRVAEPRDEQWAIELCGQLLLREAVPGLRRRAFGFFGMSADPFRWIALGVLARLGDEEAFRALLRQLRSRDYVKRNWAVQALGSSARPEAWIALSDHQRRIDQVSGKEPGDEATLVAQALDALRLALGDSV
jgi:HEAT repeat protein